MIVAYEDFIAGFPEFGDSGIYPESQFDFWAKQADQFLMQSRYGNAYSLASFLFIAHNLILSVRNVQAGIVGGVVGDSSGVVTSKSVDGVSKSMDPNFSGTAGAGTYNLTTYGQRLWAMMRAAGAGPVVIVGPRYDPNPYGYPYGRVGNRGMR